jgi:hypothetical protein
LTAIEPIEVGAAVSTDTPRAPLSASCWLSWRKGFAPDVLPTRRRPTAAGLHLGQAQLALGGIDRHAEAVEERHAEQAGVHGFEHGHLDVLDVDRAHAQRRDDHDRHAHHHAADSDHRDHRRVGIDLDAELVDRPARHRVQRRPGVRLEVAHHAIVERDVEADLVTGALEVDARAASACLERLRPREPAARGARSGAAGVARALALRLERDRLPSRHLRRRP